MKKDRGKQGKATISGTMVSVSEANHDQPERADDLQELGRLALLIGDFPEALENLRIAVQCDSDNPATWQLLGRCFEEIGEEERASRCYRLAARQLVGSAGRIDTFRVSSLGPCLGVMDPHEA